MYPNKVLQKMVFLLQKNGFFTWNQFEVVKIIKNF